MKKVIILLVFAIALGSCITNKITNIPDSRSIENIDKDRIEILGHVEVKSAGFRTWILFVPVGWCNAEWIEKRALKKALKEYPGTEGLLNQTQYYDRVRVPLVVITPVSKKITITGQAYRIRTDAELKEYLKNKQQ